MRVLVAAVGVVAVLVAAWPAHADDWQLVSENTAPVREVGYGQIRYGGHGPEWWHYQYLQERHALLERTSTVEALQLAAIAYRVPFSTLYRKAKCKSHLNPRAKNRSSTASGIGQFLDSTWDSTPYRGFSVFDPLANALAMGYMHAAGRGGEWSCQ